MRRLMRFWRQPSAKYRNFQLVFTVLTLNFALPTLTYVFAPEIAQEQFATLNELLGGAAYTFPEAQSRFWRYLGAANVATLAFMCAALQYNLRNNFPILVPLAFMKATAATLWLAGFIATPEFPAFLAASLLDYVTTGAFLFFAIGARRDIDDLPDAELHPPPAPLRRGQQTMARAVLAAMVPDDDAPGHTLEELRRPGARRLRLGFMAAVWAVNVGALVTRRTTFGRLSNADRQALLQRLSRSPWWLIRQTIEIVKTVACMGYLGRPDVRAEYGVPT